jgi:long-chain acyl-CoA synthetase
VELAKFEHIKNFILKRNPFTIEDGEMTPTLKIKRRIVEKKFAAEIDEMYLLEEVE